MIFAPLFLRLNIRERKTIGAIFFLINPFLKYQIEKLCLIFLIFNFFQKLFCFEVKKALFLGGAPTSICLFFRPSICHLLYLRNRTSYGHDFWHAYVKRYNISRCFLHFLKILIFWVKKWGKRAKMDQNWQKACSNSI